jgi:hypothetical protein
MSDRLPGSPAACFTAGDLLVAGQAKTKEKTMSSILNDPRVTAIDGGYRVINDECGPLKVLQEGPDWAVFFDSSTPGHPIPKLGMWGSRSSNVEETIEWALRTEATTEVSR